MGPLAQAPLRSRSPNGTCTGRGLAQPIDGSFPRHHRRACRSAGQTGRASPRPLSSRAKPALRSSLPFGVRVRGAPLVVRARRSVRPWAPGSCGRDGDQTIRRSSSCWHSDLAQRFAAIDEELPAGDEGMAESLKRERSGARVTSVERADPHGEGDVVALFVWMELEFLGGDLTSSQPLRRDQVSAGLCEHGDRPGRTVDCEHVAVRSHAVCNLTCRGAGAAPDLDHPQTTPKRQCVDDHLESGRQRRHRRNSGLWPAYSTVRKACAVAGESPTLDSPCSPAAF